MGKFNNFNKNVRTKDDIISDYVDYLVKIDFIKSEEAEDYKKNKKDEVMELLMEKIYETEIYNGSVVSTVMAFYHYINFIFGENPITGQKIWNTFVQNMFVDVERNKNTAIMASRGMGKSFFLFVLYSSFKMFLYRGTQMLMISNIPDQCVKNLRILKEYIDGNEVLSEKKESSKGKDLKWTEREIEYNGGIFKTLSAGTSPKGQHVHYVIIDDILTDSSTYSDEDIETYVLGQAYPCAQRLKGRCIVVGTPLHETDIFHTLMNTKADCKGDRIDDGRISYLRFYSKSYPARENGEDDGKITFPEIFTEEDLDEFKATQGELKFQREYLLKASNTKAILFPSEVINKCIDEEYKWEEYPTGENARDKQYIIGVDVATSGAASADFSAFVVLEKFYTKHGMKKIIRHVVHKKGVDITSEYDREGNILSQSDKGQVEIITDLYQRFNYALTVVEKNNVGVSIIQELSKRNVHIQEFITDRHKKESMIRYLVSEFNQKNIIIPEVTVELRTLIKELNNFGVKRTKQGKERMEALSGHDDLVMALAIANFIAQETASLPFAIVQD